MANISTNEGQPIWLKITSLTYIPPYLTNENIQLIEANDKQNKRRYNILVYVPNEKHKPYVVVCHNNQWHKCYSEAKTYRPYLGPFRDEVHMTDTVETKQTDDPTDEDSTLEDDAEQNNCIHHAPATIEVSSPGSTH